MFSEPIETVTGTRTILEYLAGLQEPSQELCLKESAVAAASLESAYQSPSAGEDGVLVGEVAWLLSYCHTIVK